MFWTLAILLLRSTILCFGQNVAPAVVAPAVVAPAVVSPPIKVLAAPSLPGIPSLNTLVASVANVSNMLPPLPGLPTPPPLVPCTCGVFLTGQFIRGSNQQPTGYPALLHEHDHPFPCTPVGNKQCANKCLEVIAKHLPNSGTIICGTIDRDCFKERAYLWTKNCNDLWENSNMSAGREFCCKDGLPYKCPIGNH